MSALRECVDQGSLLGILRAQGVRLLKPIGLAVLHDTGTHPKRRDGPEEAFLDADGFTATQEKSFEMLSIGYYVRGSR